jgi:cell fate regulator YaaT (PSP1 superfamily)
MYEKLQKEMPPLGSRVQTPDGPARVVGHEVLAAQLLVETDDRRRRLVELAEVDVVDAQSSREAAKHETS